MNNDCTALWIEFALFVSQAVRLDFLWKIIRIWVIKISLKTFLEFQDGLVSSRIKLFLGQLSQLEELEPEFGNIKQTKLK